MTDKRARQDRYFQRGSREETSQQMTRTSAIQANFFLPHLRPGMSLIDCGCGPGTITVGLAHAVAPGRVVGFDLDRERVRLAQARVAETGTLNVEFRVGDIFEIPYPDHSFDAAFVHAVLEHLNEPVEALKEVHRVLKPGGVVGVRDADFGGYLYAPNDKAAARFIEIRCAVWRASSGDPFMGRHLRAFLRQSGFVRVESSASYEVPRTHDELKSAVANRARSVLDPSFANRAIQLGLADHEELQRIR